MSVTFTCAMRKKAQPRRTRRSRREPSSLNHYTTEASHLNVWRQVVLRQGVSSFRTNVASSCIAKLHLVCMGFSMMEDHQYDTNSPSWNVFAGNLFGQPEYVMFFKHSYFGVGIAVTSLTTPSLPLIQAEVTRIGFGERSVSASCPSCPSWFVFVVLSYSSSESFCDRRTPYAARTMRICQVSRSP